MAELKDLLRRGPEVLVPSWRRDPPVSPGPLLQAVNRAMQDELVDAIARPLYFGGVALAAALLSPVYAASRVLGVLRRRAALREHAASDLELAVVVTGCDSGFGKMFATSLCVQGKFTVFACCLTAEGAEDLAPHVTANGGAAIVMDVTKDKDVDATFAKVEAWLAAKPAARRLHAVVSNAGIGEGGPIDMCPVAMFERAMAVNYIGLVRVAKRSLAIFKPQLVDHGYRDGRIVNLTSASGLAPCPVLAAYAASKHAAESFSSSLRMELKSWPVAVVTVTPTFHRTPMIGAAAANMGKTFDRLDADTRAAYGGAPARASLVREANQTVTTWAWRPERVVEALARAVVPGAAPASTVEVGADAKYGILLLRWLPPAVREALTVHMIAPSAASMHPFH